MSFSLCHKTQETEMAVDCVTADGWLHCDEYGYLLCVNHFDSSQLI